MPLPPIITEVKNVRKTVRFRDGEDGSELCEVHVVESYKQYYVGKISDPEGGRKFGPPPTAPAFSPPPAIVDKKN